MNLSVSFSYLKNERQDIVEQNGKETYLHAFKGSRKIRAKITIAITEKRNLK